MSASLMPHRIIQSPFRESSFLLLLWDWATSLKSAHTSNLRCERIWGPAGSKDERLWAGKRHFINGLYIMNPVKAGMAARSKDWPWSTVLVPGITSPAPGDRSGGSNHANRPHRRHPVQRSQNRYSRHPQKPVGQQANSRHRHPNSPSCTLPLSV
jgi:hypothetical protein